MKQKVLLTWNSNWADEMDISGFSIMDQKEWDQIKERIKNKKHDFTIGVGTNEEINYSNGEELLNEITAEKITDEEAKTIIKLIGSGFGFVNFLYRFEGEDI